MAPNPRRVRAKLDELYEQVPEVNCSGACHTACCFIVPSDFERQQIEKKTGRKLETIDRRETDHVTRYGRTGGPLARFVCSALTEDGQCSVYEDRPMICRLYGAAEGLECHVNGCECEKPLKLADGMALLNDAMRIGGRPASHPDIETHLLKARLEAEPDDFRDFLDQLRDENNERVRQGVRPRKGL